jgi:uncharacterized membrane protein YphA (DoxX/SURF4 family)
MVHAALLWFLVAAFLGAGLFNTVGTSGTKNDFVRWGYPAWWCRVTGGLEMVTALLIALPATRLVGVILGAVIVLVAIVTVVRHRDLSHLAPLGVFAALLMSVVAVR